MPSDVVYSLFPLPPRQPKQPLPRKSSKRDLKKAAASAESDSKNGSEQVSGAEVSSSQEPQPGAASSSTSASTTSFTSTPAINSDAPATRQTADPTDRSEERPPSPAPSTTSTDLLYALPTPPPPPDRPLPIAPDGATAIQPPRRNPLRNQTASSASSSTASTSASSRPLSARSNSTATTSSRKSRQTMSAATPLSTIHQSPFEEPPITMFASPTSTSSSPILYPTIPAASSPPMKVSKPSIPPPPTTNAAKELPLPPPPPRPESSLRDRASRSTTPTPKSRSRSVPPTPSSAKQGSSLFPVYNPNLPLSRQGTQTQTHIPYSRFARHHTASSHISRQLQQQQPPNATTTPRDSKSSSYATQLRDLKRQPSTASTDIPLPLPPKHLRSAPSVPGLHRSVSKASVLSGSTLFGAAPPDSKSKLSRWDQATPSTSASTSRWDVSSDVSASSKPRHEPPEALVAGLTVALGAVAFVVGVGVEVGKGAYDGLKAKGRLRSAKKSGDGGADGDGRLKIVQEEDGAVVLH